MLIIMNTVAVSEINLQLQNQWIVLTSNYMFCRIADLMENIVAEYIEGITLSDSQLNETQTFISSSKAITYSGFKVSFCLV